MRIERNDFIKPPEGSTASEGKCVTLRTQSTLSSCSGYDFLAPFKFAWKCLVTAFHFLTCGMCKKQESTASPQDVSQQVEELNHLRVFVRDQWDGKKLFNAQFAEQWNKLDEKNRTALRNACREILSEREAARGRNRYHFTPEEIERAVKDIFNEPIVSYAACTLVYTPGKNYEESVQILLFESIDRAIKKWKA